MDTGQQELHNLLGFVILLGIPALGYLTFIQAQRVQDSRYTRIHGHSRQTRCPLDDCTYTNYDKLWPGWGTAAVLLTIFGGLMAFFVMLDALWKGLGLPGS